ncbi:hypothetical protein [Synechococcus sp. CC9605]|uniref:hypothetical protein n=1 Tax=Synechococcus sp. (strain CC9605) TaxID=110662 RepID=UPI002152CCD7|nr:hypothetical protein [Synechococcus sp. CC9605]
MPARLITPSQLSLFSISPVIGAWWEELQAQKLFDGSKPAVNEPDQQLFADGLRHEQVLLTKLEKAGHSIARLPGKQTDADYTATRQAMAEGAELIHQASLCNEEMRGSADLLKRIDRPFRVVHGLTLQSISLVHYSSKIHWQQRIPLLSLSFLSHRPIEYTKDLIRRISHRTL